MLYISTNAQKYLNQLLVKKKQGTQIRITIHYPGTPYAKCNINFYFPKKDHIYDDIIIRFDYFSIYIEKYLIPFIKDTTIDLMSNELKTQLSIRSPNIHNNKEVGNKFHHHEKQKIKNDETSLKDQIQHILEYQINPQLSAHGGSVSLVEITQDSFVKIKFHGGCNGCSMAYQTIKSGIELTLKKFFPEIKGVKDETIHKKGQHSFY